MSRRGDADYQLQQLKINEILDDDNDFMRGYGVNNTNLDTGPYFQRGDAFNGNAVAGGNDTGLASDEEEEYSDDDSEDKESAAPNMPHEFYSCVDNFLKKPPPVFSGEMSGTSEKRASKGSLSKKRKEETQTASLPQIHAKTGSNILLPPQVPTNTTCGVKATKSKTTSSSKVVSRKSKPKQIDHNLLNEAFAFADQVLKRAVLDEEEATEKVARKEKPMEKAIKPKSAPSHTEFSSCQVQSSKHKSEKLLSTKGMVKKLRMKAQQEQGGGSIQHSSKKNLGEGTFNTSTEPEQISNKVALDFESLVANFQNGTTIQQLQRELEQSKKSMSASEQYMRQLSKEYGRSKTMGR